MGQHQLDNFEMKLKREPLNRLQNKFRHSCACHKNPYLKGSANKQLRYFENVMRNGSL